MAFLSKYGEARVIQIPVIKRAAVDFAIGADWTPVGGDVRLSKDGGAFANVTNLPTVNTAVWVFSLTATEMQAARVDVAVVDTATKAVEDTMFAIETYGNALAQHAFDLDTASTAQTGDNFARLGAPAGASVSADIVAVKADTAAILVDTGTTLDGRLPAALVAGRMDSSVGAMAADTITASAVAIGAIAADAFVAGAIDAAALAASAVEKIISSVSGTADASTATTFDDAARTEADADYWKDAIVVFTAGPAAHQPRRISAFDAILDRVTVDTAWTTAPGLNTYIILRTAMQQAAGAGATDWTASERNQIRDALGVDGTKTAATGGDVQDLQARLPAALVSGRIDSSVGAGATGALTAAGFATGAIDNAAFNVTETLTANPATGGIAAASFAAGAIDAAAIAADAIGTSELSTAAANKIADSTLRRTYANARASADGDAVNFRSLLGAVGKLVNKWSISGTTLTITQEDDLTSTAPGGTQALTATVGADPITAADTT